LNRGAHQFDEGRQRRESASPFGVGQGRIHTLILP
jgi:hypothetical protein